MTPGGKTKKGKRRYREGAKEEKEKETGDSASTVAMMSTKKEE